MRTQRYSEDEVIAAYKSGELTWADVLTIWPSLTVEEVYNLLHAND